MVGEVTHEEVLAMGPIGAARLVSVLRELLPELVRCCSPGWMPPS